MTVAFGLGLASTLAVRPSDDPPRSSGEPRRVLLRAKKYEWMPSTLTLRAGEPVEITLESEEGTHGFSCKELGVDRVTFRGGEPATIRVTPRRAGTFAFRCSRYCGPGHPNMKGEIVVTP